VANSSTMETKCVHQEANSWIRCCDLFTSEAETITRTFHQIQDNVIILILHNVSGVTHDTAV